MNNTMRPQLYPAMLTPLTDGGEKLDEAVFEPMIDFLLNHGADGLFILGTTGEGINLGRDERERVLRLVHQALAGRGKLLVHCGAQTTRETVALAADAATFGVSAVAVIPPPYYLLDERELVAHLSAAAAACSPTPFYIYTFSARSGYPVSVSVVERLRELAPNLAGLKVSESPFERLAPYLELGLPVFIGSEPLIAAAAVVGISGSVSGVASVFPDQVRALLDDPTPHRATAMAALREAISRHSLIATAKVILADRGVSIRPAVRAPLRQLDQDEAEEARRRVAEVLLGIPLLAPPI